MSWHDHESATLDYIIGPKDGYPYHGATQSIFQIRSAYMEESKQLEGDNHPAHRKPRCFAAHPPITTCGGTNQGGGQLYSDS